MTAHGILKNRWVPKEWTALYEQMALLSAAGMTNIELAERFKYTPQQVSNILCTPQAKIINKMMIDKIRSGMKESFEAQTTELADIAMQNVSDVLKNKALVEKNPFSMMRASLDFLKGINKLEGDGPKTNNVQNNFLMSDAAADRLADALGKSMEIKQLHGNIEVSGKVINDAKQSA